MNKPSLKLARQRMILEKLFCGATAKDAMIAAGYSEKTALKSAKRTLQSRGVQMAMIDLLESGVITLDGLSHREALRRIELILMILG